MDDSIFDLEAEEKRAFLALFGVAPSRNKIGSARGYSFARENIPIVGLLSSRNFGIELVKRMKDSDGALVGEVEFWGGVLAELFRDKNWNVEAVTYPPSSGKREYYLARCLAESCARVLGLSCLDLFVNLEPRKHRATLHEKLRETKKYALRETHNLQSVLILDDAIYTGKTIKACSDLLPNVSVYGIVLSGA